MKDFHIHLPRRMQGQVQFHLFFFFNFFLPIKISIKYGKCHYDFAISIQTNPKKMCFFQDLLIVSLIELFIM